MLNLQLQILNCCLFAQLLEDIKRVSSQTFWQHQTQNTMMQYVDAIAVLNFVNHCFNLNCVGGLNLERLLLLLIQLHSQLNTGDINRLFSIRSPVYLFIYLFIYLGARKADRFCRCDQKITVLSYEMFGKSINFTYNM